MPPKSEHMDFEILRRDLGVGDEVSVVPGHLLGNLRPPSLRRMNSLYPRLMDNHNPFIRRIIRRTRQQLEEQKDAQTQEPLLKRIGVELLGEGEHEAIHLPIYLKDAYKLAEEFSKVLGARLQSAGFLKTLLLRRMGSTIHAGTLTAQRMLGDWEHIEDDDEADEFESDRATETHVGEATKTLTPAEVDLLERLIESLKANRARDPKYAVVVDCLRRRGWLDLGCIIFSQYRDFVPAWNSAKVVSNASARSMTPCKFTTCATKILWKTGSTNSSPRACRTFIPSSASCPTSSKMSGLPWPRGEKKRPRRSSTPSPRPILLNCATPTSSRLIGRRAARSWMGERSERY
jgi:hypothetical protein